MKKVIEKRFAFLFLFEVVFFLSSGYFRHCCSRRFDDHVFVKKCVRHDEDDVHHRCNPKEINEKKKKEEEEREEENNIYADSMGSSETINNNKLISGKQRTCVS